MVCITAREMQTRTLTQLVDDSCLKTATACLLSGESMEEPFRPKLLAFHLLQESVCHFLISVLNSYKSNFKRKFIFSEFTMARMTGTPHISGDQVMRQGRRGKGTLELSFLLCSLIFSLRPLFTGCRCPCSGSPFLHCASLERALEHIQSCVSRVILNPAQLTMEINHDRHFSVNQVWTLT